MPVTNLGISIGGLARYINRWAEEKGWNRDLNATPASIGIQVANMHSELSEAWECIRDGCGPSEIWETHTAAGEKPEGFRYELADAVIRILHTCEFYGLDIEAAIETKMRYNEKRAYRHGGKTA
jgi:NTP pyrophosphatase (non-canonical NTP hydrolase)